MEHGHIRGGEKDKKHFRILLFNNQHRKIMNSLKKPFLTILLLMPLFVCFGATELILKSGSYRAELESRFAWTIHKFDFKGKPLLVGSGWMGTAIKNNVPKGKDPFTGTGHGGEKIESIKLIVDGKEVKIISKGSQTAKGSLIEVVKKSMIGPLKHISRITLSSKGLKQSFDFEMVGDSSKLINMYLFMSIWNKSMDQWLASSNTFAEGTFNHDNKFIQTKQNKWVALLNPRNGIAGICVYQLPEKYKSFFWDRKVDNKHYIKYYPKKKNGSKFSCTSFISAFPSNPKNFKQNAIKQAAGIKKMFSTKKESSDESIVQNKALVLAEQKKILKMIKEPLPFKITYPAVSGKVVNAADFGFSPDAKAKNNTVHLQKAIDHCKKNNLHKLIVPKGKYHLLKSSIDQRDQGKKYNHYSNRIYTINLIGMKDFVFDGQGSEFIIEDLDLPWGKQKLGSLFRILECDRVQLKNLTIDWVWDKMPLGFKGKIVKVDSKNLTVDYHVSYNGKPIPKDFHVYAVRGWDPVINNRTTKSFEFWWKVAKSHKMTGPNTLRFTFKNEAQIRRAKPGMWAIFKSKPHFFAVGIIVDENKNVSIDNVTIYGVPSSAINGRRNESLEIVNCNVMPRPGTEKVWTSHSGFEIHNSLGHFKMENNYLEFTHDDALHFSSYFLGGGFKRVNKNSLQVLGLMYWQAGDTFIIGDTYEFRKRDYSPTGFKAKLKSFKWTLVEGQGQSKHYVTAVFDKDIPSDIKQDGLIFNISSYGKGQFHISNNTIKNALCHGFYIGEPNGIIENNRITDTAYPALVVHSVIRWNRWHIGIPPRNIIIRGNYIENANTALRPPADVFIGGGIDPQKDDYFPSPFPIAQNILVEDNIIKNSQWQALAIWSAKNIIVRNNKIINPNRLQSKKNYDGTIHLANVKNIVITGNQCKDNGKATDSGIALRKGTCKDVFISSNLGMNLP
jgi:hypothetical protein